MPGEDSENLRNLVAALKPGKVVYDGGPSTVDDKTKMAGIFL